MSEEILTPEIIVMLSFSIFIMLISTFGSAYIARKKGVSAIAFFLLGLFFNLLALIIVLLIPKNHETLGKKAIKEGQKRLCPHCAEINDIDAFHCRFCGQNINSADFDRDFSQWNAQPFQSNESSGIMVSDDRLDSSQSNSLARLRSIAGDDVKNFASRTPTEWICVCGTRNPYDKTKAMDHCRNCTRSREHVLKAFSEPDS